MVPNWRVLKDGWGRPGIGAERWLESPDVAIADTGPDDRKESLFWCACLCKQGKSADGGGGGGLKSSER
jgi:hypothetical protein